MFIRFMQPDPHYKVLPAEVAVNVGQIVKIEPVWFAETPDGQRYLSYVGTPNAETLEKGLQKEYVLYDSLGNKYRSEDATPEGRDAIERLWKESV